MTRRAAPLAETVRSLSQSEAMELALWLSRRNEACTRNGTAVSRGLTALLHMASARAIDCQPPPVPAALAPTPDSVLMTYQDAADTLRCSIRTVHRRVADGVLTTVGKGSGARVRRADVLAYARTEAAR